MKVNDKTMKDVAERCTRFSPCECSTGSNSTSDSEHISCKNCAHYEDSDVCTLDLYQEILKNHDL